MEGGSGIERLEPAIEMLATEMSATEMPAGQNGNLRNDSQALLNGLQSSQKGNSITISVATNLES